ncbi:hypothetical protein Csa_003685 [Cucumis sativus]|uniref:Uncharacterized protein n=1 Tax=Cucumis sativus TaxID=3659 RepID=A0A0A0KKF9_CUCSA|nr:hypothetical protein Csa_003685 [Cucumis sativus]
MSSIYIPTPSTFRQVENEKQRKSIGKPLPITHPRKPGSSTSKLQCIPATSSLQLQQANKRKNPNREKHRENTHGESKARPYSPLKPLKNDGWCLETVEEDGKKQKEKKKNHLNQKRGKAVSNVTGWKIKAQISEQASHEAHEVQLERKVIEKSKTQETPLQRNGGADSETPPPPEGTSAVNRCVRFSTQNTPFPSKFIELHPLPLNSQNSEYY